MPVSSNNAMMPVNSRHRILVNTALRHPHCQQPLGDHIDLTSLPDTGGCTGHEETSREPLYVYLTVYPLHCILTMVKWFLVPEH